jgi:hypothetical protein
MAPSAPAPPPCALEDATDHAGEVNGILDRVAANDDCPLPPHSAAKKNVASPLVENVASAPPASAAAEAAAPTQAAPTQAGATAAVEQGKGEIVDCAVSLPAHDAATSPSSAKSPARNVAATAVAPTDAAVVTAPRLDTSIAENQQSTSSVVVRASDSEASDTKVSPASGSTRPPAPSARARTGTVHDFFGGADTSAPSRFVLRWPHETTAQFCRAAPGAGLHKLGHTFKWRGKDVSLYCGVALDEPRAGAGPDALSTHDPRYPSACVALLKSHLQKCVRRCLVRPAVATARHLLRIAPVR